jgi:two-component system, NarL family, nitrate/nitrite response regulator NarL
MEGNVTPHDAVVPSRNGRSLHIAVVSDVRYVSETVAEILERDPPFSVVGLSADLAEAVAVSPALDLDVILLDAGVRDGAAAVSRALKIAPGMRIITFPVRETEEDIIPWAEAGAIGYIPSTVSAADLPRLVLDIQSGEQVCPSHIASVLFRQIALASIPRTRRKPPAQVPSLTKRERQAAELIRTGLCDKDIARRLNISLATAKSHVHTLLGKLNVQRRSEVAEHLGQYRQRLR